VSFGDLKCKYVFDAADVADDVLSKARQDLMGPKEIRVLNETLTQICPFTANASFEEVGESKSSEVSSTVDLELWSNSSEPWSHLMETATLSGPIQVPPLEEEQTTVLADFGTGSFWKITPMHNYKKAASRGELFSSLVTLTEAVDDEECQRLQNAFLAQNRSKKIGHSNGEWFAKFHGERDILVVAVNEEFAAKGGRQIADWVQERTG